MSPRDKVEDGSALLGRRCLLERLIPLGCVGWGVFVGPQGDLEIWGQSQREVWGGWVSENQANESQCYIFVDVYLTISSSKAPRVWKVGYPGGLSAGGQSWAPFVPTAILGMHTLMSNQQYYQALGSSSIVNKEGLNSEYTALLGCCPPPLLGPETGSHGGHLGRETPPPASWCRAT